MKKFVTVVCVLAGVGAQAQEIGTELPADQTQNTQGTSTGQTNYDNPYGQPATTTTPTTTQPGAPAASAPAAVATPGPRKGAFGIRASFAGGGAGTTGGPSGTFALRYLATEAMAVDFDVGLGVGLAGSRLNFGFGLGFGITAYMGSKDKPIRPLFTGGVSLGKVVSNTFNDFGMNIAVGGGGEYWFNDHFSVDGKLLVGVPIAFTSTLALFAGTFTPSVGANFYF